MLTTEFETPQNNSQSEFPPLPIKPTAHTSLDTSAHIPPRAKSYSQTITLPVEEQRRPTLGEKLIPAEVARTVMRATGVDIDMSSSALTRTITMVVKSGDEAKVIEACKLLRARLAIAMRIGCVVPTRALGAILGKGGRTVKAIMQEAGVRITVPDDQGTPEVEIVVEGSREGCFVAKQKIEDIVHEVISHIVDHLELPGYTDYFICGPVYNRSISQLQSEFPNIKISLYAGRLTFSGDAEQVCEAMEVVRERILILSKEIKQISTTVPKYIHKHLVGAKGVVLRAIEEESKCLVVIPPPDDDSNVITLHGLSSNLVKGLQLLIERTEDFHEEPISCPHFIRSFLLHKYRQDLRRIEKENEIMLRQEEAGFVAVGSKSAGAAARIALKTIINSVTNLHFDTLHMKREMVRHVIGRQGHGLERIQHEFSVDVVIEETDDNSNLVLFVGREADCVIRAKKSVSAFLTTLENEEQFEVPIEDSFIPDILHHLKDIQHSHPNFSIHLSQQARAMRVRGPKGPALDNCVLSVSEQVSQIKNFIIEHSYSQQLALEPKIKDKLNLKIMRNRLGIPSDLNTEIVGDLLTLKGASWDIEAFSFTIQEYLTKLADQTSKTIPVEEGMIGKLIGKGGRNIQSLYDQYSQVNVKFEPKEIVLSGSSKQVELCFSELNRRIQDLQKSFIHNSVNISLPLVNRLLSKQAEELHDLQKKYSVRLFVDSNNPSQQGCVRIEGEGQNIEKCLEILNNLNLEECEKEISLTTEQADLVANPFNLYYRNFISTKIPSAVRIHKSASSIKIHGPQAQVSLAHTALSSFLSSLPELSVQVVTVEQRFHGLIIGQKGSTIKKLMNTYDVSIEILKQSNEIVVAGLDVDGAIDEIMSFC